jgi:glycosyltransferase involved in cell wall biosynthesis
VHDKDHRTLLRAFRDVHATHAAARLVVAGEGDAAQVEELSRLARELGVGEHVALIGGRSDVPRLYSAADVVVQSSRNEGSSNVIIEALASGSGP